MSLKITTPQKKKIRNFSINSFFFLSFLLFYLIYLILYPLYFYFVDMHVACVSEFELLHCPSNYVVSISITSVTLCN